MMTFLSRFRRKPQVTASKSRKVKLVVPREFGLLITAEDCDDMFIYRQSPDEQLDLASRLITVALERRRAERREESKKD
jgi:hypothetical protein